MHVVVETLRLPKRGASWAEYEDASWVSPHGMSTGEVVLEKLCAAVADGATESLLASRWAAKLVQVFGLAGRGFLATYQNAAADWDDIVAAYCAERVARGVPIQWYEEPGLARGAYATLLATQFRDGDGRAGKRRWSAVAVGDSCVFQVRDEALYSSFPLRRAAEFSSSPALLPSRLKDRSAILRHVKRCHGPWQPGDSFYLMTDAIAAWFLGSVERGGRPWETLRNLTTGAAPERFEQWVDHLREAREIRDDDTTVVQLDFF